MIVKDLLEVKLAQQQRFAYVEIIEGRMGEAHVGKAVISADDLQKIATDDDAFEDWAEEHDVYNIGGALNDNWKDIKRDLQKQGHWSGEIEEGAAAFSAKGPKHAMGLAKSIFSRVDDSEEEDWY